MKHALLIVAVAASLVAMSPAAHADGALVAAEFQFLPSGEIALEGNLGPIRGSTDVDTEAAYGVALVAEYPVHRYLTVGLAPRFLFNVKGEDADEGGTQLDLPVRVTGRFPVGRKAAVFGFVAPGFSIVFPGDWPEDADKPAGFVLGFGGGAAFQVSPTLAVVGELGYTKGYQGGTDETLIGDAEWTFAPSFLHLGIGLQTRM